MRYPGVICAPMERTKYYKAILQEEFSRRSERNPKYSLRAFARTLKVDPASLSKILSDQMVPSWKLAQTILEILDLKAEERNRFLSSVAEHHNSRNRERLNPAIRQFTAATEILARELTAETFRVIADWYHYAILELTFTRSFRPDPTWIAQALDISPMEAKLALQRLMDLELLREEDGTLKKSDVSLTIADKQLTTPALRRRQKQVLEKAIESLERDPIHLRDTTSLCMAIDPKKIPEAKRMIQEFKKNLCAFLESGNREQVYELAISMFPTQKINQPSK